MDDLHQALKCIQTTDDTVSSLSLSSPHTLISPFPPWPSNLQFPLLPPTPTFKHISSFSKL